MESLCQSIEEFLDELVDNSDVDYIEIQLRMIRRHILDVVQHLPDGKHEYRTGTRILREDIPTLISQFHKTMQEYNLPRGYELVFIRENVDGTLFEIRKVSPKKA